MAAAVPQDKGQTGGLGTPGRLSPPRSSYVSVADEENAIPVVLSPRKTIAIGWVINNTLGDG